jgi:hypothetical protein
MVDDRRPLCREKSCTIDIYMDAARYDAAAWMACLRLPSLQTHSHARAQEANPELFRGISHNSEKCRLVPQN